MTEEELERQARLWHVDSVLESVKTVQLGEKLRVMLPKSQVRRRWQITGLALLGSVPLGGIFNTALKWNRLSKLTKIEAIETLPRSFSDQPMFLSEDGKIISRGSTNEINLWEPGKSLPQRLKFSVKTFPDCYTSVKGFSQKGDMIINVTQKIANSSAQNRHAYIWKGNKFISLPPLAGYENSEIIYSTAEGVVGYSLKKIFLKNAIEKLNGQPEYLPGKEMTIWRNEIPEKLVKGSEIMSFITSLGKYKDSLINLKDIGFKYDCQLFNFRKGSDMENKYVVFYGYNVIPVNTKKKKVFDAYPLGIGSKAIVVGSINMDDARYGAIWDSPSAEPRPLWESKISFGEMPTECVSIDDEGKVVGMMVNPITEAKTPFVWRKGRYFDLQKLLPTHSGWKLTSARQVRGRFILGDGEYKGKKMLYRLTLPPGIP